MYIESITIKNFRVFREATVEFVHADRRPTDELPVPKRPNINLLLGNNGLGKTTLLKAVSLTALGPAVTDSGIYPYMLIRREPGSHAEANTESSADHQNGETPAASIEAVFKVHPQDLASSPILKSLVTITKKGELERLRWRPGDEDAWRPIFSSSNNAFFCVGYGATRRVEKVKNADTAGRRQGLFPRAQRIQGLFEDAYSLLPLAAWLPSLEDQEPGRFQEVVSLVNRLLGRGRYRFTREMEDKEYIFKRGGLRAPFPALSDGYRAYLGWIGDLLYHVCSTCPPNCKITDNRGIVMVDEIDLHIHPKWQINMLPVLARALPNIQFIVTSHSPLAAGSLEWMNIILMTPGPNQTSLPRRLKLPVSGLDADQMLLTDFFGLRSTRAPAKESRLRALTEQARAGDVKAAKTLLRELANGME
ncbi:MAG: AAA family ATPase [Pseudomonadota bacterium]